MTKRINGHKDNNYRFLQATIWGEFFLTIILVVFLFPSSQFLYANSSSPPTKIYNASPIYRDIVSREQESSLPEDLSDKDRYKNKNENKNVKKDKDIIVTPAPEISIKTETSDAPEKPEARENPALMAPVFRGNPESGKKVAITIDDGPYAVWTAEYLKVLEEYQAPAAFFMVGSRVEKYPEIARKITERGFEIGSHSYRHDKLTLIKPEMLDTDFQKSLEALNLVGSVQFFRPPYGAYNQAVTDTSEKFGLKTIGWSVDPRDWETEDPEEVTQRVLAHVKEGAVILLHEGRKSTLTALPKIITGLRDMGYQLVTVSELLK